MNLDDAVIVAMAAYTENEWRTSESAMRAALAAVTPLIQAEALEQAAGIAENHEWFVGGIGTVAPGSAQAKSIAAAIRNQKRCDMTKPELMALCAIRYTIGRSSYIVSEGVKWAKEWGLESEYVRKIIIRDLAEAVVRCDDGAEALGDIMDEKAWREVLADLLEIDCAAKGP
jgi:hypothetical protein